MNNKADSMGDRMKRYEKVSQNNLMNRTPVLVRADGKAFHTYTRGLVRPFDKGLLDAMAQTTLELCNSMQGALFGYTQSDEISILLQDWATLKTDAWFGNNVQKIVSVSASIATGEFNRIYTHPVKPQTAVFDARAFNLPFEEVANYFVWRQQDCTRNSISSLAQANFSHNELHKKSTMLMQDMLMDKFQINWNDIPTRYKRGTCVVPNEHNVFAIDTECPVFTQDRQYVERLIIRGEQ